MRRSLALVPLLAALAACDRDPAELARQIEEARAGCTEEKLRAADEECIRMMETYSTMGTEVMEGYIGAVKSLDQALQRLPPAQFDTTMGHALSRPRGSAAAALAPADDGRWSAAAAPRASALSPSPSLGEYGDRWEDLDPRDRRPGSRDAYGPDSRDGWDAYPPDAGYGYDPRYGADPRYGYDPRRGGVDPRYDPRYGGAYAPGYGQGYDPRYGPSYDPRFGYDPALEARIRRDPRARRFPVDPRGALRAPDERLRRPWLEEDAEGYDPRTHPDSDPRTPAARARARVREGGTP